ncbi:ribosome assembly factor SBDS [candidate division KSB1 bacterium]
MDHERVSFNLAKLKKGGQNFEVAVDADLAIAFKNGKEIDVKDIVRSDKIFSDVKKGVLAPENMMTQIFNSIETLKVAAVILKEGEIQLTQEHREKLREEKRKKIVDIIRKNGVDPKTKLPHPPQRIENAMAEARVSINEFGSAEDQVDEIVKKLRSVLPISFEKRKIEIKISSEHAGKAYGTISQFAKPQKEEWLNDGSYACIVEIPAGLEADLYEKINNMTHGTAQTKVLEK